MSVVAIYPTASLARKYQEKTKELENIKLNFIIVNFVKDSI